MRTIIITIILLTLVLNSSAQFSTKSTDLNTRPYCSFVFTDQEFRIQKQKNEQILIDLGHHFNRTGTHFISSLIKYFNGQRIALTELISEVKNQTFSYFSTYLLGLLLLVAISIYWCFGVCFQRNTKQPNPQKQNNQILLKIQLALAGLALSLLFVIILSIYGINQSAKLQLTVNQFFCEFFQEPQQFLRNKTGPYNLTWYAKELEQFESFLVNNTNDLTPLIQNFQQQKIVQHGQTLLHLSETSSNNNKQFNQELSKTITYLQNLGHNFHLIKTNLQDFHLTIQYVREVAIGFPFVLTLLEKQINKMVKVQNFSSFFSSFTQYIYLCFIFVSLVSMIGIIGVTILQITSKYYIKDIFFYFMGIFSFIGLLAAIVNSVLVSVFLWFHDTTAYVLPNERTFRTELNSTKFLNNMIVEVIVKFHPLSDGDYSTIYNSTFAKNCDELCNDLSYFESHPHIGQSILQKGTSYFNQAASKNVTDMQLLTEFSNQLSSPLIAQMATVNSGLKAILLQMDQTDGALGRLDSSALGRYIGSAFKYLLIPSINNSVENRWIFGFCGYALLLGLLFAYLIHIFSLQQVRVQEPQFQKQPLSNWNNSKQTEQQGIGE